MKIEDLFEAFNSNYPIQQESPLGSTYRYSFTTETGNTFFIYFEHLPTGMATEHYEQIFRIGIKDGIPDGVDLSFYIQDSDGNMMRKYETTEIIGNEPNPVKIFSTVMNMGKVFLEKSGVGYATFDGDNALGSLYARMVPRYVPSGYKYFSNRIGSNTKFLIIREEFVV